jgi:hypothetical protein
MIHLSDIFKEITTAVNTEVLSTIQANDSLIRGQASKITEVSFEHGHILEIIKTLSQKNASNEYLYKRFPLIAMIQDTPINRGGFGLNGEANLHLLILNSTDRNYVAEERKEKNFKPVLYQIYESLFKQISYSPYIFDHSISTMSHTQIDRYYWGKDGLAGMDGNIFNDWVDCIEIKNLKLKLSRKAC